MFSYIIFCRNGLFLYSARNPKHCSIEKVKGPEAHDRRGGLLVERSPRMREIGVRSFDARSSL